jgi:hypothetical protein
MEQQWNDNDRRKSKDSEKTYPSVTLPTKNPTWADLGMNTGLHDKKLPSNSFSYDKV